MEKKASSGAGTAKHSLESSCDDDKVSGAKKMKTESVYDADGSKLQKKSSPSTPQSNNKNVLKRSGDFLSKDSPSLSPSKKRKTGDIQGGVGKNLNKDRRSKEEMDKKKRRMKNKSLLKAVLEQMEFYFSDSNLGKDRYLRKLYDSSENGDIDLSVFSNFNKLQSLRKGGISLDILCKALTNSKLLKVNDDHTKVTRRTPIVELDPEEIDRRTIYVEHLPNHASHSWVKKIFSQCGRVCYVSLPTYQTTKEIKGFAFVEFSSAEEAGKACSMLNNPPPEKTEEKPGKFPKGNKDLNRLQKSAPPIREEKDSNEENVQSDSKEEQPSTPTKKKKKKNLKRKMEESMDKDSVTEQNESQDEKKKRKKKKKKQLAEGGAIQDKDNSDVTKTEGDVIEEQNSETPNKAHDKDVQKKVTDREDNSPEVKNNKKKRRKKKVKKVTAESDMTETCVATETAATDVELKDSQGDKNEADTESNEVKLSRKERKRLRQEDIRRKKELGLFKTKVEMTEQNQTVPEKCASLKEAESQQEVSNVESRKRKRLESVVSESSETDDSSKLHRKRDGSQLMSCLIKSKKQDVVKKVEFDPVPVTTEFVERKEVRRRKKPKRESLHLRVLSKQEWLALREEYISKQKSHMSALKESLRELRMQENNQAEAGNNGNKHIDLTNVFGTKRMKPSQDMKLARVEELKFIPNVIVQWKCSYEINRNKIKTMFKDINSDNIAYIEGKEEAKSGYIRFKDETSAEEFARLSRNSESFSARVLPESQQAQYWEKANQDRLAKLSKKKKERGTDKIARKVFERNKATFLEKGSHIVFDNNDDGGGKGDATSTKVDEIVQDATTDTV